jgi:hypothetical protein
MWTIILYVSRAYVINKWLEWEVSGYKIKHEDVYDIH